MKTINQNLIKAKYEVRGGIVIKADELRKEMEKGKKMPFDSFVPWNIGNPQALGQLPISFTRELFNKYLRNSNLGNRMLIFRRSLRYLRSRCVKQS
jgi:hypothetical protein